jgi:phosphoglycolate phosphatase
VSSPRERRQDAATRPPAGFDLDMTLIDSRRVIMASFAAVSAATGVPIDPVAVDARLGIKLEDELAFWFPAEQVPAAAGLYREHYLRLAGPLTAALPGAREALAAVRGSGARAVVITAKHEVPARLSLDLAGLAPDDLVAGVHGPEKAAVLVSLGAGVYVGDTPADMAAAAQAGACAVGVTTGSFTGSDLRAAGAQRVLASLAEFPALYVGLLR